MEMTAGELRQTRSELLDLARDRGYARNELAIVANAYHLAHILADGGYRPCGRPFINHLVGTASVLLRYGFRSEVVATGLLHSAYTHCPNHPGGVREAAKAVCSALGGRGSSLERRVRDYTLRESPAAETGFTSLDPSTLSVPEAETLAVVSANELDMYLSGEIRYTGRTDLLKPAAMELIAHVCDVLGVSGLYRSLEREQQQAGSVPDEFRASVRFSYRIGHDRKSAVRMASNVNGALP